MSYELLHVCVQPSSLYLSQHGVRQLADLLHMLSADVQLTATDPQKGAVGELLAVQLHLNEVVLPGVGVLDTHLQNQLCRGKQKTNKMFCFLSRGQT